METLTTETIPSETEQLLGAAAFSETIDMSGFEAMLIGPTLEYSGVSHDAILDGVHVEGFNSLLDAEDPDSLFDSII